jgi:tetratricopeptide (TPR) repeat protein
LPFLLALVLGGCIYTPVRDEADVIPNRELNLVSAVAKAKEYALSGRNDLAERQLLTALKVDPGLSVAWADLGYVLSAQNRNAEAVEAFKKAIQQDPKNPRLLQNAARSYYKQGEYTKSIEHFEKALTLALTPGASNTNTIDQLAIYREMSAAYEAMGLYDEALCHLRLASYGAGTLQAYARALLAYDSIAEAVRLLQQLNASAGPAATSDLVLDYVIALVAAGEEKRALELADRVLQDGRALGGPERSLQLLSIAYLPADSKTGKQLFENLLEQDPRFCSSKISIGISYLPTKLLSTLDERVSSRIEEMCANA